VNRVIDAVNNAFPNSPGVKAGTFGYYPRAFTRKRDGTILLQYDPQQNTAGTTQALVRMYVNGNRLEGIIWDPLPGQLPPPGKRHVGPEPGCTPVPTTMITATVPAADAAPTPDPTPPLTTTNNGGQRMGTSFPLIPPVCTVLPCFG
jgi:hypothetical protein